jgi:pyruvate-formate lyase-activating enzyme
MTDVRTEPAAPAVLPTALQALPYLLVRGGEVWNELRQRAAELRTGELEAIRSFHQPRPLADALRVWDRERVEALVRDDVLVDPARVWEMTDVHTIEIEISTRCNWRCEYCPVSLSPKPPHTMALELFQEIVDKAVRHGIRRATLNSYNEPTLDVLFDQRIEVLAKTPIKIDLHTNGSALTARRLDLLARTGVAEQIFFNLPSLDAAAFRSMTGAPARTLDRLRSTVEAALRAGLPVRFSIQGSAERRAETMRRLHEWLGPRFDDGMVGDWPTTDRAGALSNDYCHHLSVRGPLTGCADVLNWLYVAVNGNCFICCEDYHQKVVFANVRDGEFADVLRSERAQQIRRWVYGAEAAPADFLCRACHVMAGRGTRPGGWTPLFDGRATPGAGS